jgi:terminal uridylyltransferase
MRSVETLPHPLNRKINSPYQGTLSSYGYVLMVIYFLVHVKNPAVLPNLQQMPPLRPISKVFFPEFCCSSYSDWVHRRILIWVDITPGLSFPCLLLPLLSSNCSDRFFDDIELLRQRWQSSNVESVAEL